MVNIRNVNDIVLGLIDYFKLVQPNLDTKPGTVARDLFIDAPSSQIALIYDELASISNLQSIQLSAGSDLDKLGKNYGLFRKKAIPSTGTALLTFNSVDAPFAINAGDLVITTSGISFSVTVGTSIIPASINSYKATATKYRNDLDFVGIKDQYAIQVLVQCSSPGTIGNIGKYYLSRCTTASITGATNTSNFSGGADQETDTVFRNRILAMFNGSSIGTSLGYRSSALSTQNVVDATVIEPGDSLMTRDGTVVSVDSYGNRTIVSEGQGGKVDVIVLGQNFIQNIDTFIYQDKSNTNDPTSSKNDFTLGQILGDENKTINKRRVDNIASGTLPSQPVDSIASVSGSLSGPNFVPKTIDSLGRVYGNYELVKDTGVYSGSPWGFDKFVWVSNKISGFKQDSIKGQFNGQDTLSYSDVLNISNIQQNISITNENSTVTNDRSIIQLLHTPCTNVTRVFNVNTGERYLVTNQNFDGSGSSNKSGRIQISGSTLPTTTDTIQVDYTWIVNYDQYSDYDGKLINNNIRPSNDSVDWGYSSKVKNEKILFTKDNVSNIFTGVASAPISAVISCNVFSETDGIVSTVTSGIYAGRKSVQLYNLPQTIESIDSVYLKNTNKELYLTSQNDGTFISSTAVVGESVVYNVTVILPYDTAAVDGQYTTVTYNSSNTYTVNNVNGSFTSNIITIPSDNISIATSSLYLNVSYIANVFGIYSSAISMLPISRSGNGFLNNNLGFTNVFVPNNLKRDSKLVQKNQSNQYYIEFDITTSDFTLNINDILLIARSTDGYGILWDSANLGTITFNISNNKYQAFLSGYNSPKENDQVIVLYYANNKNKYQPISFYNQPLLINELSVKKDPNQKLCIDLISFVNTSGISIDVIDPITNISYGADNSATLQVNILNSKQSYVSSLTDFSSIIGINNYKLKIVDGYNTNNNGIFDIVSYDVGTKTFIITNVLENISKSQISVIRLSDNKEIWNGSGTIDYTNNKLILPSLNNPTMGDEVICFCYKYNALRKSPTKISSSVFDQNTSSGSITVSGTSITKIEDVVFTSTSSGLQINFIEAIVKGLGLSSALSIPSSLKLARVVKLEKVQTVGNLDDVAATITVYNLLNSQIRENYYYSDELIENTSLDRFSIIMPSTINNTLDSAEYPNIPKIGDKLRATIYVTNSSDSESLNYTAPGVIYTNKKYIDLNKIYVNSGFKSSNSSVLTLNSMTQPLLGSRYSATYDYTAPKTNERITITYNYNQTITDATFTIEQNRPINADVIVKQAVAIPVDVTMNIVVSAAYTTSSTIVAQNVRDILTSSINLNSLGGIIDASDLVNSAYSISGVDRARIIYFNKSGLAGQVLSLVAQKNEYFVANTVTVNVETR